MNPFLLFPLCFLLTFPAPSEFISVSDPMQQFKEQFTQIVAQKMEEQTEMTPDLALESLLDFHQNYPSVLRAEMEDADWLMVRYDFSHREGQDSHFEIDFIRYVTDHRNGQVYQFRLTLYYPASDIPELRPFKHLSWDHPSLKSFVNFTKESLGYQFANDTKASHYAIQMEKV